MIASMVQDQRISNGQGSMSPIKWDDAQLVAALRQGDETAFEILVGRYHTSLIRLAQHYVSSYALAEEVAQDTWLGVLQGLKRFEGRSSLKTWIFHILTNRAKTRGQREGRSIPFSALEKLAVEGSEPAVDPQRFRTAEPWADHWAMPPQSWEQLPEERMLSQETRACIDATVATLPPNQRLVLTLRDIEGFSSQDVCGILDVSESNQRVLLHRARSRVRSALEHYYAEAN
jgi:RNA polymerase sigma-70 factor (ECF subfamily)